MAGFVLGRRPRAKKPRHVRCIVISTGEWADAAGLLHSGVQVGHRLFIEYDEI